MYKAENTYMGTKLSGLLLLAWLILGIMIAGILTYNAQSVYSNKLEKNIANIVKTSDSTGDLLDQLPGLFDKEFSLGAILVADRENNLLGSMYEKQRVDSAQYQSFLNNFRSIIKGNLTSGYSLLKFSHPEDIHVIYLLFDSSLSLGTAYSKIKMKIPYLPWGIATYMLAAVVLILIFLTQLLSKPEPAIKMPATKREPVTVSYEKKPAKKQSPEHSSVAQIIEGEKKTHNDEWRPVHTAATIFSEKPATGSMHPAKQQPVEPAMARGKSSLLFENQLAVTLNEIAETFNCSSVTFFLWEDSHWVPLLQKRGGLLVKGHSLHIPGVIENITRPQKWDTYLKSPDMKQLLVPVKRKGMLIGAFMLQFETRNSLSDDQVWDVQDVASQFARAIFVQRTYERAVIDDDTELHTYPYFFFALKERLFSERPFAALIFEIPQITKAEPEKLQRWAKAIRLEVKKMHNDPGYTIAARIDDERFVVLQDLSQSVETKNLPDLPEFVESASRIKTATTQILNLEAFGAIVPRSKSQSNIDSFLKRLDAALAVSLDEKSYGGVMNETISAVL